MFRVFIISFFLLTISIASGQTDFISISGHGLVLTNKPHDINYYHDEIKIDIKTGDVYYRKKSSKHFKLIDRLKNDSTALYLKSVTRNELDSVVRKNMYKVEVTFKVEFIHWGKSSTLPDPAFTYILEFGYPIDDNKYLRDLIKCYYQLKNKIKT